MSFGPSSALLAIYLPPVGGKSTMNLDNLAYPSLGLVLLSNSCYMCGHHLVLSDEE